MIDFPAVLRAFEDAGVDSIVVGGLAATIHGATRLTQDVDFVYARNPRNIERLVEALRPHAPYLRGAPPGLPFEWAAATIARGLNFTLATAIGDIDLLGEIPGGGDFQALLPHTIEVAIFGHRCRCLNLPALIRAKRAAGRPKDLEGLAELEAILAARQQAP